jgi:hypothetical protein
MIAAGEARPASVIEASKFWAVPLDDGARRALDHHILSHVKLEVVLAYIARTTFEAADSVGTPDDPHDAGQRLLAAQAALVKECAVRVGSIDPELLK